MQNAISLKRRAALATAGMVAGLCFATGAWATDPCGLCDEKIVINSELAACFLDEYPYIAGKANGAVVVDLSNCEQSRSVVEPLPIPGVVETAEPDMQFILTREQLVCLKSKLEAAGADP